MRVSVKSVINEALRLGIEHFDQPRPGKPYKTEPFRMGARPGLSYDNIGVLLAIGEGEGFK